MELLSNFPRDPELEGWNCRRPLETVCCYRQPMTQAVSGFCMSELGLTQALEGGTAECHRQLFNLWL